ncbi:MAG: hypothetical protein ACK5YK_01355 [Pseudomonadota bacterium]|jgi:hypothetical protein
MSLFVVSRRKIVYQQGSLGASQVVYVPSTDQVQVLKDSSGAATPVRAASAKAVSRQGPALYRALKGQRVVYGHLPLDLRERRERLKVWLAEDLVLQDSDAFFYVFSPQVVVHGVRERTDEGKLEWRTAQLMLPEKGEELKPFETALADFMFANQDLKVCVAVVSEIKLFRAVQALTAPLGLTPVPFSTLKPMPSVPPLYSHYNFTWVNILVMAIGVLGVVGMASLYILKQTQAAQLEREITQIESQIQSVQINPRVGHIRQAAAVLAEFVTPFSVSPTSLISAAGEPFIAFGQIRDIKLGSIAAERIQQLGTTLEPGQIAAEINLTEATDLLLADQEARAKMMLTSHPWVRKVIRHGTTGSDMGMIVILQPLPTEPTAGGAAQ